MGVGIENIAAPAVTVTHLILRFSGEEFNMTELTPFRHFRVIPAVAVNQNLAGLFQRFPQFGVIRFAETAGVVRIGTPERQCIAASADHGRTKQPFRRPRTVSVNRFFVIEVRRIGIHPVKHTAAAVRTQTADRPVFLIVAAVQRHGCAELFELTDAADRLRLLFCRAQSREQHSRQNCNDSNHYEEFYQCKPQRLTLRMRNIMHEIRNG